MKKEYGVEIEIGKNHIEYIKENRKEEISTVYQTVLKGKTFFSEEQDVEGQYWNIHKSPIKNREGKIIGVITIVTNITELKLKEIQLEKNNYSLNERIKELNCLYDVSEIFRNKTLSKSEKLEACVHIIPKGMQFPEISNCRIQLKDKEFISGNNPKSDWSLHQLITVNGEELGSIEVGYFDAERILKENPFLDEEVKLLEAISGVISKAIETKMADENLKISEEKFRSIFENTQDVYYIHNLDGKILEISPSVEKHFKYTREEMIGKYTSDLYYDKSKQNKLREKITRVGAINDEHVEFVTATGEPLCFSVNCKIILDNDGTPSHIEGSMRNINERITNQQKLVIASEKIKESEEKFRSIYENMQDIYFMQELDGTLIDISPSVEKNFSSKREDLIGLKVQSFYCNPARFDELTAKILKEGLLNDQEVQFLTSTGEKVFFSVNARLINNLKSNRTLVEGTMRNINERIKNQNELLEATEKIRQSEEEFRAIFESFEDLYYRTSLDGYIQNVSPSVEKILKYKREEIIDTSIVNLYSNPEDRNNVLDTINEKGHLNDFETVFKDKENNTLNVSINAHLIYDSNGTPMYIEGTIRDISQRKQNELEIEMANRAIKESEAKFRSIYENFEDVYYKTELDGTVIDLSPSFEKHFKMKRSDFIGNATSFSYLIPEDRNTMLDLLKKNGHIRDFDTRYIDGEGNNLAFSINARTVFNLNGKPLYVEGTMRNINERSIMQEEMLAKNRILKFQNTELEQFAYIASHDLQEPLITVIQCVQLLQEGLYDNLDEEKKQYLEFINNSTSRMQLLVKGLLDYSRIGKGRKNSQIDCNEIVANVLADMDVSLKESNAIVEYENLPIIEGYTTEIRQLFQNVISNANKYRKKGQQPKIKIAAVKEENNWTFSIEDNGIGIKEEDMDKVFVIFKRLHNRDEYQGTGIGLSHCKKIVEHHNGAIWVESEYNEGSTFKWTFPIELN